MTSDIKPVQLSLEEITDQLDEFIAALPELSELDGRLYRKSSLSGVYYPVEVKQVERYTRAEWEAHIKICPNCIKRHDKKARK